MNELSVFIKYFCIGNLSCFILDNIATKLVIFSKIRITSESYIWFYAFCI